MKKILKCLVITSFFILGNSLAHAEADVDTESHHERMQEKMYQAMDSNADGMLTSEEFNSFFSNKFKELDVNGNGQLTLEEMKGGRKKMDDNGHKKMDNSKMNSDGMSLTHKDSSSPIIEEKSVRSSSESCCWTPKSSGAN